jgi:hypothetical protein
MRLQLDLPADCNKRDEELNVQMLFGGAQAPPFFVYSVDVRASSL